MFCYADAASETLARLLRPGNAGANSVRDHVSLLDRAIAQFPPGIVQRDVVVQADSADCTEAFLPASRQRAVGFLVSARSNAQATVAIMQAMAIDEV